MKKRKKNWELTPQERVEKAGGNWPKPIAPTQQDRLRWAEQELKEARAENSKLRAGAGAYTHLKKQTVMILEEGQDPVVLRGDELDAWVVKSIQREIETSSATWKYWSPGVQPTTVFFDEVTYDT